MSPNQTSFFLIVSAFLVAALIVYFNFKRDTVSNFTQKCENDYNCVNGLKCVKGECIKHTH